MNQQKKVQLEKIYLTNVLLYIKSIDTIKKFSKINEKCKDVLKIVRFYSHVKPRKWYVYGKENSND